MADSKSIELKDFSAAIEPEEEAAAAINQQEEENLDEITAETPFLSANNETTTAEESQVANQPTDPAATQQEAEVESLLVRATDNIDEIQTEPAVPAESALDSWKTVLTGMTIQQWLVCVGVGLGLIFAGLFLLVLIPSCISTLEYDEVSI